MTSHENCTSSPLTPDQKVVSTKSIKNSQLALEALLEMVAKECLDHDYAKNLLSLIEFNLADISKQIDVPIESQAEVEKRFADIRAANARVRALEQQIGDAAPIDQTIEAIKVLESKFENWWRTEGFGHTRKFSLRRYCAQVTLSGSLSGNFSSIFSESPVSDKENKAFWIQSLVDQGYILAGIDDQHYGDIEMVDCDTNRQLIAAFISSKFSSAEIISTTNFHNEKHGFAIREIKLIISDLREINALPSPPTT